MGGKFLILCASLAIVHLGYCYPSRKFAKACQPLQLRNGRVKTRPRTFAQFICNKGYLLAGERYSKCTQGQWDTAPPTCVRPTCKRGQQLKNGVIHPSHRGGVLNFYCGPAFTLEGPSYAYCEDTQWNSHMPSCLPSNATPSMSCDFETEDICGWSHDLNHNFDWTRMNNRTPSGHLGTGPSEDHTKGIGGNGYYMYIEATTRNMDDTARLISPVYKKLLNNTCLEFYYHMYGSGIGELRVYIKRINESWTLKKEDAVFVREGNHGNEWFRAFLELGNIDQQFQVVFEGIRGISFISDIAIDDVKLVENCAIDITTTTEQEVEESTFSYESCSDRCNTTTTLDMTCSCEEDCFDNSTCCADYIAVCLLSYDSTISEYPGEEDLETTTETNEIISTTLPPASTAPSTTVRVTKPQVNPTTPMWKIYTTLKEFSVTKPQIYSNKTTKFYWKPPSWWKKTSLLPNTTTASTIPEITTTPSYLSRTGTPLILTSTNITSISSTLTTKNSTPVRTTARVITTKYPYPLLNDMLTLPNEVDSFTDESEVVEKEYSPDTDSNHNLLSEKTAPIQEKPRPTNTLTVIAVLTMCFIVIGILGLVFFIKRYTSRGCMGVGRMRHGTGDSQSDVRFLTSDEILDFTIAKPTRVY